MIRGEGGTDGTAAGAVRLRLICTSDLHMQILPYDYRTDRPAPGSGLAAAAVLIRRLRAEVPGAVLLDNGDFLQGTPMGDLAAHPGGLPPGAPHPMIAAMNALGYDAATLGNHDFDYGLEALERALAAAAFPIVSANLVRGLGPEPAADRPLVPPWALIDRTLAAADGPRGLRLGVIGFAPPQTLDWSRSALSGRLFARDIAAAAAAWVPRLRAAGADIVVALCHSGIGTEGDRPAGEEAAPVLARAGGIDAIVAGHAHLVFPSPDFAGLPDVDAARGTLHGLPAVMPGVGGSHVGVIDLDLVPGRRGWRVAGHAARALPVPADAAPDPAVASAARTAHRATIAHARRPIGRTATPLTSYFALAAPDAGLSLVATALAEAARRALAGSAHAHLPLVVATGPFRTGGRGGPWNYVDIPAGPLALRHLADLCPYPNTPVILRATGAELALWLERAAGVFARLAPGRTDQPLLDPEAPGSLFDVLFGLTYTIDPTAPARFAPGGRLICPAARRIGDLACGGRPVAAGEEFALVTSSYRAGGGGAFPLPGPDRTILALDRTCRELLADHIAARGTVAPRPERVWSFRAPPGTGAVLTTGPGAAGHLPLAAGPTFETLGAGSDGFLRLRVRF
jgi:2',3'-cyclic-nucleotide 2'-phosphodiesterase/3'-nucleotidase